MDKGRDSSANCPIASLSLLKKFPLEEVTKAKIAAFCVKSRLYDSEMRGW
jgi:hypothetical protein